MDPRTGNKCVPLPKDLPLKDEGSSSSESNSDGDKRRRRKTIFVRGQHPEDRDAYPVVESPGNLSPSRRDSGVYSIEGSPRRRHYYYNAAGQRTYAPTGEVSTRDLLYRVQTPVIEAEKAGTQLREEADKREEKETLEERWERERHSLLDTRGLYSQHRERSLHRRAEQGADR